MKPHQIVLVSILNIIICNACAISQRELSSATTSMETSTMTQETHFKDLYVKTFRPKTESRKGFIFFHGFPGAGVRNEDLGEEISKHDNVNCFVVHFGGLGNGTGKFGFRRSVEQSLELIDHIMQQEKLDTLSIYGHSWGGLVAINAAAKLEAKLGKLILVSPYSMLPPRSMAKAILSGYIEADPALANVFSMDEAIEDVDFIDKHYNPRIAIQKVNMRQGSTLFLQAKEDNEVPAQLSQSFLPLFSVKPDYREVNQDHSFTNRAELIRTLVDWLG